MKKNIILGILAGTAIISNNAMSHENLRVSYKYLLYKLATTPASSITPTTIPYISAATQNAESSYTHAQKDTGKSAQGDLQKGDSTENHAPKIIIASKKTLLLIEGAEKRIANLKIVLDETTKRITYLESILDETTKELYHFYSCSKNRAVQILQTLAKEIETEQHFIDWLTSVGDIEKTTSDESITDHLTNEEAKAFLCYLRAQKK